MKIGELYFWELEPSPHKLPLFCAMKRRPDVGSVFYVADQDLGEARRAQGWAVDRYGSQTGVIVAPGDDEVERIVRMSDPQSIHVFSGMHWWRTVVVGLAAAIRHRRRFGILHEPRVLEGVQGLVRLAHSWLTESRLRRHAEFVLAVGRHGPAWFRLAGFGDRRIFPFAYFLENNAADPSRWSAAARPRVAYVGRLETLKGVDVFLDAIALIRSDVEVHIAGHGSLEGLVRQRVAAGTKTCVFHGVVPIGEMTGFFDRTDILALPSVTRDDGWGAVVSEALFRGVAVVTSDRIGASICATVPGCGRMVRAGDPRALAGAVDDLIACGELGAADREHRRRWAAGHLSAEAGAAYLMAIFDHLYGGAPRPADYIRSSFCPPQALTA